MKKYLPWIILAMLFVATGLNFLDRQVLSMTILKIQQELDISNVEYGIVNTSFLISYAIMFTVSGWLIDRVGGKLGLALSVGIWSIASCLHGFMTSFYHLIFFRFLLGVGEGGCFPGAAKVVYDWFSERKRALAMGIAIGGSALGAVVAPPLTTTIALNLGWRWSFVIPGLIGLVWLVIWLFLPSHRQKTKKIIIPAKPVAKPSFISLLKNRQVLTFIGIRFLLDPVMYFIMFWAPKYLSEQKGVSFERIGELFWIPFLALGVSNILGGWFSDGLAKLWNSIDRARKVIMGLAAVLTLGIPLITFTDSVTSAITLMSLMMFAHGLWITNYMTLIADIFGSNATSSVVGLSGTAGAIAGLAVNPLIGLVIENYSYDPVWIVSGFLYPAAFIALLVFIRTSRTVATVR